jgi:peptidoglycan/xylan/chitin deacetylase (PgdA/CDA1 family)
MGGDLGRITRFTRRAVRRVVPRRPAPLILMYHRVAEPSHDPWGLSVSPDRFAQQLAVLRAQRRPVPMTELVAGLSAGTVDPLAVAVTFDDGYLDNLRAAKPLLAAAGVPATVFLTTNPIQSGAEQWWDELARMTLGRAQAADLEVTIGDRPVAIRFPAIGEAQTLHSTWRAWDPPTSPRERSYYELWTTLRRLSPPTARAAVMEVLRDRLDPGPADPADLPLSPADVAHLVGDGIEIGAHSQTHAALCTLAAEAQREEIDRSRQVCEALAGQAVTGFAYPHGDRDDTTRALVAECGFQWACSTESAAANRAPVDLFDLPRLAVPDCTGSELQRVMANPGGVR